MAASTTPRQTTTKVTKDKCEVAPGKPAGGSADCVLKTSPEISKGPPIAILNGSAMSKSKPPEKAGPSSTATVVPRPIGGFGGWARDVHDALDQDVHDALNQDVHVLDQRCSFCRKPLSDVRSLMVSERVSLCDECIGACNDILESAAPDWRYGTPYPLPRRAWANLRCSSCGTNEAAKLIESVHGPHICNVCVVYFNDGLVAALKDIPGATEELE